VRFRAYPRSARTGDRCCSQSGVAELEHGNRVAQISGRAGEAVTPWFRGISWKEYLQVRRAGVTDTLGSTLSPLA